MKRSFLSFLDKAAYGLTLLFALDRLLKMTAVIHFFRRPQPPPPPSWPEVTLLQPITRGTSNLLDSLQTRARLDYPSTVQHLLICDANDVETRTTVLILEPDPWRFRGMSAVLHDSGEISVIAEPDFSSILTSDQPPKDLQPDVCLITLAAIERLQARHGLRQRLASLAGTD